MKTCTRCGLADETVLDLDTGSACHPELWHCIEALKAKCERLDQNLDGWQECGDAIMRCVRGRPGPLSDSDVIGEIEATRHDVKETRKQLERANRSVDFWKEQAVELNERYNRAIRLACEAFRQRDRAWLERDKAKAKLEEDGDGPLSRASDSGKAGTG